MPKEKKIRNNYLQKRHKVECEEWLDKEYLRWVNNYPCEQSIGGCREDGNGIWYPYYPYSLTYENKN